MPTPWTNTEIRRISDIRRWRGGGGYTQNDQEETLFTQYIARLNQLPDKAQPGAEEYKPIQRNDFEKLSVKRRILELRKIGMDVDSTAAVKTFFVRKDEGNYPATHTKLEVPEIQPKHTNTSELLHHKHHLGEKIKRLYGLARELRREGRMVLR